MGRGFYADRGRDPVMNAMTILYDRTRTSDAYQRALAATLTELIARPDLDTVEGLRAAGGWSQLIRDTWARHAGTAMTAGSKLLPPTPLATFQSDLQSIRCEVQNGRRKRRDSGFIDA